eukprot:CAMPEP_0179290540 /NCGR_PEP_ID=MMETSP0797-20121207/41870_1 /TAXON_ID=47934 /ORGANISM="Dinophysis acuminata, Strain DAEP01" /LENGTH=118 /DNA_ID=CAMNT_0020999579 /DNA_START=18 /DNA_END=372 /DNA_ORIENTATION=-
MALRMAGELTSDPQQMIDSAAVGLSGLILVGAFGLQRSLGDVIADEAELASKDRDVKGKSEQDKKTFLKKRKDGFQRRDAARAGRAPGASGYRVVAATGTRTTTTSAAPRPHGRSQAH